MRHKREGGLSAQAQQTKIRKKKETREAREMEGKNSCFHVENIVVTGYEVWF